MTQDILYSAQFDDVYFSRDGGLAETRHVFLAGNNLPERWKGCDDFTIAETGFGTGLNFLATWKLFEESATPDQRLHYISFEKYPLSKEKIYDALSSQFKISTHSSSSGLSGGSISPLAMNGGMDCSDKDCSDKPDNDDLLVKLEQFLSLYPARTAGFHCLDITGRVRLTLVFDDVNEALAQLVAPRGVDAWFLDGFTPAKNPEMWSETLFTQMARLSAAGATCATYTVAGFVRRGLETAGFSIEKKPGFGMKRNMTAGVFSQKKQGVKLQETPDRIAIIGGGLAGTACAYVLKQRGLSPVLFEASDDLAAGASGNRIGMMNPRLYTLRNEESDFYASAFGLAGRVLAALPESIEFNPCGALHLAVNAAKEKRYRDLIEKSGWPVEAMSLVDAAQATEIAGVEIFHAALWLSGAGTACPAAVCHAYAAGVDVRLNAPVAQLEQDDNGKWMVNSTAFDTVIIACGAGVKAFSQTAWAPIKPVRGQASWLRETKRSESLKCCLCYGGYITPAQDGVHVVGSTFQKWLDHTDLLAEDDVFNLEKLAEVAPDLAENAEITGARAGLRMASHDHFPLIGKAPDYESWKRGDDGNFSGLYMSAGHGSHGVVSSIAGAQILADMILGMPVSQSQNTLAALSPVRFLHRARWREML